MKWLETSRSCPICRHEVGPARTQRERDRLAARSRQEENDLNLWYGLMLDELEDDEATRMANDAAISRILLEDAATSPAEISSTEKLRWRRLLAGSSQTTAALMAIRGEQPKEPPAPVARTDGDEWGTTYEGVFEGSSDDWEG